MKEILSRENPQFKLYLKLLKAKKYRVQHQLYLAEGRNALDIKKQRVRAYLMPESLRHRQEQWEIPEEKLIILADGLFRELSQDPASQGILAVVEMDAHHLPEKWWQNSSGLYLALEDIQDPGNLGSMIRTAEAAGVDAILCSENCVDLYHPKVVKAAASALSRMKIYSEVNLGLVLKEAEAHGITAFATTPLEAIAYTEADYRGGSLFLIGNEGRGLSQFMFEKAARRIYIPMSGQIESLNASVSAAIILFEAKRQRA